MSIERLRKASWNTKSEFGAKIIPILDEKLHPQKRNTTCYTKIFIGAGCVARIYRWSR